MLSSRHWFLLFNFLGLEVTWAACAYGATHEMIYLGVWVGLFYILLHFIFTQTRRIDFIIMLVVAALGITVDYINNFFNLLSFSVDTTSHLSLPYWLIVLWLVFALMIPHSLYWLSRHFVVAAITGASVGSFSYWLGHKLGALYLADPLLVSVAIFFIEWGILFPLFLFIAKLIFDSQIKYQSARST